jgi:biotin transport system substrate-specific component
MTRLLIVFLFTTLTAFSAFVPLKVPFLSLGMPHDLPGAEAVYHLHGIIFGYHVVSAQILLVWLSGAVLGARRGALAMIFYLALGLGGLPIFTDGGGLHYIAAPTFGYLAAFIPAVVIVGYFADTHRFGRLWLGMAYALLVIDGVGLIDEVLVRGQLGHLSGWWYLANSEVLQFLPGQLALLTTTAFLVALWRKLDGSGEPAQQAATTTPAALGG